MKAIIYFGNLGTTAKAATLLAEQLSGCSIYDGTKDFFLDYALCEDLIFGVNVRMGRFNKKFLKFYKKFKCKYLIYKVKKEQLYMQTQLSLFYKIFKPPSSSP